MMKSFSLVKALLLLLVFAIPTNAADVQEIRAGTDLDFRPWSFLGKDGQPTGFGVELLQAVAEKAALRPALLAREVGHDLDGLRRR